MEDKNKSRGFVKVFEDSKGRGTAVAATNSDAFEIILKSAFFLLASLRVILLAVQAMRGISASMNNRRKLYAYSKKRL